MINQTEKRIKISKNLSLSPMGCGTWAWGNRFLWGYDKTMDNQLQEVFNLNVKNGITWFDTGDSYGTGKLNGRSEILLGKFYQEYQGINKNDICIATKLAVYPWRLTRKSMINACKKSAQRLQKAVDLAQMHWSPANYFPWQEKPLLNGLADLYEQGLVKAIGLSNYGPKNLQKAVNFLEARGVKIATLQIQYSLLSTYPINELGLKEICHELGIKIIAYSPLTLGLLTGKYQEGLPLPKGPRRILFKQLLPKIKPLLACLKVIADSRFKTMSQVALNWCICNGTIPIPGAKTPQQAGENLGALGWRLSEGEIRELEKIALSLDKKMIQNVFQTK
jgi:pyridoxine 4-dehydrogenase